MVYKEGGRIFTGKNFFKARKCLIQNSRCLIIPSGGGKKEINQIDFNPQTWNMITNCICSNILKYMYQWPFQSRI